jgi:hypothetical protein
MSPRSLTADLSKPLLQVIGERAQRDEAFRARLLGEPRAVLAEFLGGLPDALTVRAHEDTRRRRPTPRRARSVRSCGGRRRTGSFAAGCWPIRGRRFATPSALRRRGAWSCGSGRTAPPCCTWSSRPGPRHWPN